MNLINNSDFFKATFCAIMALEEIIDIKSEPPVCEDFPNPWLVDSIQDFTCLKCPECFFWTKEEFHFQEHAFENHPLSVVFFENDIKGEELNSYENPGDISVHLEDFIKYENNPLELSENDVDPSYSPKPKKSNVIKGKLKNKKLARKSNENSIHHEGKKKLFSIDFINTRCYSLITARKIFTSMKLASETYFVDIFPVDFFLK